MKGSGLRKIQTLILPKGSGHCSFDQKSLSLLKVKVFSGHRKKIIFLPASLVL